MKYKKLLIICCIVNVLLVMLSTFFVFKINETEEILTQNEQNLLREFVKNQEGIKTKLNSSLKEQSENSEMGLIAALSLNVANIKLHEHISIPNDLRRFHFDLNVYITHLLMQSSDEKLNVSEKEDIIVVIEILTNYEEELNFNFYDSPSEIQRKLDNAVKEVITPFLNSNSNPF
ncbi:hypothetical protein [Bacillus suaedae]|uniref:Uncharacterized protein n=1 Tax=Halalkalibacter suaedae TaxID=2822140 RepID=A0A941APS4_9BACI|nr:hypothetical protein [Bacillus suaedae]MBP3951822.1 hypothetical protein [Bacillus suaedae]